jgi:hypothetical protein
VVAVLITGLPQKRRQAVEVIVIAPPAASRPRAPNGAYAARRGPKPVFVHEKQSDY